MKSEVSDFEWVLFRSVAYLDAMFRQVSDKWIPIDFGFIFRWDIPETTPIADFSILDVTVIPNGWDDDSSLVIRLRMMEQRWRLYCAIVDAKSVPLSVHLQVEPNGTLGVLGGEYRHSNIVEEAMRRQLGFFL